MTPLAAVLAKLAASRKAVRGGLGAGITYLIGVIPQSGGFGDVPTVGWLGLVLAMLGTGGVVFATSNQTAGNETAGSQTTSSPTGVSQPVELRS